MHFLQKLSHEILSLPKKDLKDLIVILPNVRARVFLNKYLKENSNDAIFLPRALSSRELMEKISGLKSAEDFQLLTHLYRSYPRSEGEEFTFDLFLNWGRSLLQDFKEVDHQLADAEMMFSELSDLRKMEFWHPGGNKLSEFQVKYLNFCQKLPEIYASFCSSMEEDEIGHQGYIERMAYQKLHPEIFKGKKQIIIAGFNALTKAEENIFKYIESHFETTFFWDYDHYYFDNELHEAGHFGRLNKHKFHENFEWLAEDFRNIPKTIHVHKCSTSYEQSFVISEILKNSEDSGKSLNTAIILPDEGMLFPVINSLPSHIKDINITMGYPLSNSPYYPFFEDLIKAVSNARERNKEMGFYHKDVFRLLHSDAMKEVAGKEFNERIESFLNHILKNNILFVPLKSLNSLFSEIFSTKKVVLEDMFTSEGLLRNLKSIIIHLDKNASDLNHQGPKINREFLLHHFEVIEQVKKMMSSLEVKLDLKIFHKVWRHFSKMSKVQFTGEPLKGIQIMGLLESRNLDFDHVILLNVNEGILPSEKRYGSLLPNDLKRQYGLHLHREKDAVVSYHFHRLLQRAKKVDLLYSTQSDVLGSGEKSRYIIQLERELPENSTAHSLKEYIAKSNRVINLPKSKTIERSPLIQNLILNKFEKGLSPTSIATYIRCPKDFYFEELLNLKYKDEMVEKVEDNVLGSALHSALEMLYTPFKGKKLNPEDLNSMKKKVRSSLDEAFDDIMDRQYLLKGKNLLDYKMAEKILNRYLEKEKAYASKYTIEIIDLEIKAEKEYEIEWRDEIHTVKIKGFVDRIERRNGMLHVIDYKSGNVLDYELAIKELNQSFEGKDKVLQLLIYAMLNAKSNESIMASVAPLKKYSIHYMPVQVEKNKELSPDLLKGFEEDLIAYVKGMLLNENPLQHNDKSRFCKYC